ncbi:hypothetical protein [Anabaena lutea]|uniref:Uncharacterized protein n=1 Tax=Anabaena lutea FACHB-196 TaxID=2692881 RepID=A0ABR8FLJ3_9NOST|nr:hypothetical protein [Anabaena lutea]MBD2570443.1 hypothetical protein [Anabaena lutea FACHB-196]
MIFAKPQKGLVPIGNNFYATPNKPQKPNYSEPFQQIIDLGLDGIEANPQIGIGYELVYDGCNIGLQATGFLGWVKLPSSQFLWHNPSLECNPPPPPQPEPLDDEPYPFPPPPPNPTVKYLVISMIGSITRSLEGIAISGYLGEYPDGFNFNANLIWTKKITRLEEVPPDEILIGQELIVFPNYRDVYATHVVEWEENYFSFSSFVTYGGTIYPNKKPTTISFSKKVRTYLNDSVLNLRKDEELSYNESIIPGENYLGEPLNVTGYDTIGIDSIQVFTISRRSYNELISTPNINKVYKNSGNTLDDIDGVNYFIGESSQQVNKPRLYIKKLPDGKIVPPPPPPPKLKPEKKKMCDCKKELALLKLLLQKEKENKQDITAIENYINQLDVNGKEIANSISRLNIVANVIGFFVSRLLKLFLRG